MKKIVLAAAFLGAAFAVPADATIILVDASTITSSPVVFGPGSITASTLFGRTATNSPVPAPSNVAFTGTSIDGSTLLRFDGGRISGAFNSLTPAPSDTVLLSTLSIRPVFVGENFNSLALAFFGGGATSASFRVVDNAGDIFDFNNLALSTGMTAFGFQGIDGQSIRTVQVTFNGGGIVDASQIRLGGAGAVAPVPEPATWAMMLVGFGAVGYSLRKRPVHRSAKAA